MGVIEAVLQWIRLGDDAPFVLDETLIYRPNPLGQFAFVQMPENGDEVIWTEFDEQGHRVMEGGDIATAERTIGVYGDSFIQGSFVRSEETFAYFLHQELAPRVKYSLATFNAGTDGYGPDQAFLRLQQAIPRFRHDVVVFSIFADNDLGDMIRNKILVRQDGGSFEFRPIEYASEVVEAYREKWQRSNMLAIERALRNPELIRKELKVLFERRLDLSIPFLSSVVIESAYRTDSETNWIEAWLGRSVDEFKDYSVGKNSTIHLDNIRSDHYDVDVSTMPRSDSAITKMALFDFLIGKLAILFEEAHILGLLLIIPSPIDVCQGYDWEIDPKTFPDYDPRLLTNLVEQIAVKHGLSVINLFNDFHIEDCHELYFHHGNNHWTPRAQELAATRVADRLLLDKGFSLPIPKNNSN